MDQDVENASAVLTGDLVASSSHSAQEIDTSLSRIADEERWMSDKFLWPLREARFTRSRGDGWQMLIRPAHEALRRAIILNARQRAEPTAIATRIAIGIGTVDSPGTADLSDASGEAFVNAGRCLELMPASERLFMLGNEHRHPPPDKSRAVVTDPEKSAVGLIDWIASRWTPEQAEAAALYLHPAEPTLADIAGVLGISPQAVGYRVRGAGAPAIRAALKALESEWQRRWGS